MGPKLLKIPRIEFNLELFHSLASPIDPNIQIFGSLLRPILFNHSTMLSGRALRNVKELDVPWRFAPTQTYDPETNPTGLISLGMAENVSRLLR